MKNVEEHGQITYITQGVQFDLEIQVDVALLHGGSSTCVLLIPGIDGSRDGYKNKYKTIAEQLNYKYDTTVVRMSNPHVPGGNWELNVRRVIEYIEQKLNIKEQANFTLYAVGFSLGGYIIGSIAHEYDFISKLLLINPASKLDCTAFFSKLRNPNSQITILLGEHDPMMKYIEDLQCLHCRIAIVGGADHNFSGEHFDTFLNASAKYLFEE